MAPGILASPEPAPNYAMTKSESEMEDFDDRYVATLQYFDSDASIQELNDMLKEIETDCLVDDWDGEGADPITAAAIRDAKIILNQIKQLCAFEGVSQPEVSPAPDGGIIFDWMKGKESLAVEVFGDGLLVYAFLGVEEREKGEKKFAEAIPEEVKNLIRRFD